MDSAPFNLLGIGGAALAQGRDPKERCAGGKAPPTAGHCVFRQVNCLGGRGGLWETTLLSSPAGFVSSWELLLPWEWKNLLLGRCAPHPALGCKRSGLEALGKAPVTIAGGDGNLE